MSSKLNDVIKSDIWDAITGDWINLNAKFNTDVSDVTSLEIAVILTQILVCLMR